MKVLIIDNDNKVVSDITFCLQVRYPDVVVISVGDGESGMEAVATEFPDLVFIDSSLPDIESLDVIKKIRETYDVALLVITGEENPLARAKELEMGADQYIKKPFVPVEFLAKVRALLRRVEKNGFNQEGIFKINELTINFDKREVYVSGKRVYLTPTEFDLLSLLVKNEGKVLSHNYLLGKVWGFEDINGVQYIKKYISRLRNKLDQYGTLSKSILTERGIGYRYIRDKT